MLDAAERAGVCGYVWLAHHREDVTPGPYLEVQHRRLQPIAAVRLGDPVSGVIDIPALPVSDGNDLGTRVRPDRQKRSSQALTLYRAELPPSLGGVLQSGSGAGEAAIRSAGNEVDGQNPRRPHRASTVPCCHFSSRWTSVILPGRGEVTGITSVDPRSPGRLCDERSLLKGIRCRRGLMRKTRGAGVRCASRPARVVNGSGVVVRRKLFTIRPGLPVNSASGSGSSGRVRFGPMCSVSSSARVNLDRFFVRKPGPG